jgi:hypothetical protein
MPFSFRHLRDFLQKQMRMSHIYQPVMVRELLTRGQSQYSEHSRCVLGP